MFFGSWDDIFRVLSIGVLAYIALIILLRISGKRTLSKLNSFDLVVTVAVGSTTATILLSKDVTLAEGVVAYAVLIFLQFIITWTSVRSHMVKTFIKSEPALLVYQGELMEKTMKKERVMKEEIQATLRQQGFANMHQVEAVVLETDGSMSVVKRPQEGDRFVLEGVRHFNQKKNKGRRDE